MCLDGFVRRFNVFAQKIEAKKGDLHVLLHNIYDSDLGCLCNFNVVFSCTRRSLLQDEFLQKPHTLATDLLTLMSVLQRRLVTTIESPQLCISTSLPHCHVVNVELSCFFVCFPYRDLAAIVVGQNIFLVRFETTLMTSGGGEVEDLFV